MAKKKSTSKKHRFKHVDDAAPLASANTSQGDEGSVNESTSLVQSSPSLARPTKVSGAGQVARDFSYVSGDLRRIAIFAVGLVTVELVLYFLLSRTSLGSSIYQMVKL